MRVYADFLLVQAITTFGLSLLTGCAECVNSTDCQRGELCIGGHCQGWGGCAWWSTVDPDTDGSRYTPEDKCRAKGCTCDDGSYPDDPQGGGRCTR